MQIYQQNPDKISRVIPNCSKSSNQPPINELLQMLTPRQPSKGKAPQYNQFNCIQMEIDPAIETALALNIPVYQLNETKACWFLSVLYGLFEAGWIRSLFEDEYIKVQLNTDGTYKCEKEGTELTITKNFTSKRPFWQQIVEAYITNAINGLTGSSPVWLDTTSIHSDTFQKRLRGVGAVGAIPRDNLKASVEQLLKMICSDWEILSQKSSTPSTAGKVNSPLRAMTEKKYLTTTEQDGEKTLDLLTVEKSGHAMGVKNATLSKASLPGESKTAPPTGVKVSNINVFNQWFDEDNIASYKKITPSTSQELEALKKIRAKAIVSKRAKLTEQAAASKAQITNLLTEQTAAEQALVKKKSELKGLTGEALTKKKLEIEELTSIVQNGQTSVAKARAKDTIIADKLAKVAQTPPWAGPIDHINHYKLKWKKKK